MTLQTQVPLLDAILEERRPVLGEDYIAYRNHCRRVFHFCRAISGSNEAGDEKTAIAAAFHDLGIWTAGTFDYLEPSKKLAREYLAASGQPELIAEIEAMIGNHHKLTKYRRNSGWVVESFRKADWIDVSKGILTFGLPRAFVNEVLMSFPNAGFHERLVEFTIRRMKSHPFSPLPMMRF